MIGSEMPDDILLDLLRECEGAPANELMGHLLAAYDVAETMGDAVALAGLRLLIAHVGRAYPPRREALGSRA